MEWAAPGGQTVIRALIDASNLSHGGGVQVAVSFIEELAASRDHLSGSGGAGLDLVVWASPAVISDLSAEAKTIVTPPPAGGMSPLRRLLSRRTRLVYDVEFIVFGPIYRARRARQRIEGCADVRSFFQTRDEDARGGIGSLKQRVRAMISRAEFRRADCVVVESKAMDDAFRRVIRDPPRVVVVSNTYNGLFDDESRWSSRKFEIPRGAGEIWMLYVARRYPHKNHEFLAKLAVELRQRHAISARFILTLSLDEWTECSPELRAVAHNVGVVPIADLPALYRICDAVIFPSLLEAFSAAPLEALRMGVPTFASDRPFVRSVCGDAIVYFDPLDAVSAADRLASALAEAEWRTTRLVAGRQVVQSLPSASARADAYLDLIKTQHRAQT